MRIKTFSEHQIQKILPTFGSYLISISSPSNKEPIKILPGFEDVLYLSFDDIDPIKFSYPPNTDMSKYILFNSEMANSIVEFLKHKNKREIEFLAINCEAGVSRSVGIKLAIDRFHGNTNPERIDIITHNELVCAILTKALWMDRVGKINERDTENIF